MPASVEAASNYSRNPDGNSDGECQCTITRMPTRIMPTGIITFPFV